MSEVDEGQPVAPAQRLARGPVALIYSPHAGSARDGRPQERLERAGVPVALSLPVYALDDAPLQGQRWREAGCVAAVAAGGDGTVGVVATHAASADLPLGVLPLGSSNDVARALEIPLAPDAAAQVIAQGALRAVDAGQVVPSQTAPQTAARQASEDREAATPPTEVALNAALTGEPAGGAPVGPTADGAYFLHAMTLGVNAEFARRATDPEQRRLWGRLTYAVSAIESLERLRPIKLTLRFTGAPGAPADAVFVVRCETALLAVINLPVFGGRLSLRAPGVRPDDQLLDVIILEAPEPPRARVALESALGALSGAAQSLWERHAGGASASAGGGAHPVQNPEGVALPGARWLRARAIEIETEQPTDLTLDGELRGRTPAVARVAPTAVQVIVPGGAGGVGGASGTARQP